MTEMTYRFLAPVLSAQFMTAPTGRPRVILYLFPAWWACGRRAGQGGMRHEGRKTKGWTQACRGRSATHRAGAALCHGASEACLHWAEGLRVF